MPSNYVTDVILSSAVVSAISTAVLLWLTKSWVGERLKNAIRSEYDEKLETHKAQLKSTSEVEIERLKSQLNIAANENNILFSRLHETRAEVIAETYSLLRGLFAAVEEHVNPGAPLEDQSRNEKYNNVLTSFNSFRDYHPKKQIFLPKAIAEKISIINSELLIAINLFDRRVKRKTGHDSLDDWMAIDEKVNEDIKAALNELEDELRKLLGDKS